MIFSDGGYSLHGSAADDLHTTQTATTVYARRQPSMSSDLTDTECTSTGRRASRSIKPNSAGGLSQGLACASRLRCLDEARGGYGRR